MQNDRTAGIAFNLILIRVAQNRANPEPELPTFIGDSTVERAMPATPRDNPETVVESTPGQGLCEVRPCMLSKSTFLHVILIM